MGTNTHSITRADGWVKVADAADDQFWIENGSDEQSQAGILVRLGDAEPDPEDTGHRLLPRESTLRLGTGDAYVRVTFSPALVVVTT